MHSAGHETARDDHFPKLVQHFVAPDQKAIPRFPAAAKRIVFRQEYPSFLLRNPHEFAVFDHPEVERVETDDPQPFGKAAKHGVGYKTGWVAHNPINDIKKAMDRLQGIGSMAHYYTTCSELLAFFRCCSLGLLFYLHGVKIALYEGIPVDRHPGSRRNDPSHDNVFLEPVKFVNPAA